MTWADFPVLWILAIVPFLVVAYALDGQRRQARLLGGPDPGFQRRRLDARDRTDSERRATDGACPALALRVSCLHSIPRNTAATGQLPLSARRPRKTTTLRPIQHC